MSKHTAGPWIIRDIDEIDPLYLYKTVSDTMEGSGMGIAIVTNLTGGETNEANAALIAAAPELLEACKYALDALTAQPNAEDIGMYQIQAAIAKAEEA